MATLCEDSGSSAVNIGSIRPTSGAAPCASTSDLLNVASIRRRTRRSCSQL
jgi:hypothetical protein